MKSMPVRMIVRMPMMPVVATMQAANVSVVVLPTKMMPRSDMVNKLFKQRTVS